MRNEAMETMLRVRHVIEPSEKLSDEALGQIGLLLHTTCAARAKLGVAHARTQPLVEMLVGAAAKQAEVRGIILGAHDVLASIGREVIPAIMQGDHGCPGQNFVPRGAVDLHVVESAAA